MVNDEYRSDDELIARVLHGQDAGDGSFAPVAVLLRAAVTELESVDAAPEPSLLAAMVRAATLADDLDGGDELARRRRRRIARIALAAGAIGLSATGAAAANGSLPDSVQDVVHDVAQSVGIDLPAGSQDGPGHGRSDEAPGRPEVPGQPDEPGRSDEAPGRPDDPGSDNGVGPDETPPGQGGTVPGTGPDETPPGHGGTVPGTGEAPGQPDDPGDQGGAVGSSGGTSATAPSSTAPARDR